MENLNLKDELFKNYLCYIEDLIGKIQIQGT
jgi:hypothetical protein